MRKDSGEEFLQACLYVYFMLKGFEIRTRENREQEAGKGEVSQNIRKTETMLVSQKKIHSDQL